MGINIIVPNLVRKYKLNEEYFSHWTSQMAYVLGFWYADGHMRHEKSYRIYFTSKDKEHLISIKKLLETNSPLTAYGGSCVTLVVHSKRLFQDLLLLGGVPGKSNVITFPKIPPQFLPDFIRGYFDGDGSVHRIVYKASKKSCLLHSYLLHQPHLRYD
ncbi:MAG: hypothetical protein UU77_C0014G0013 [candidate division WWE3 bacterium GW2011_GWC1_41_7]|uniref:DOD-type homing endonuclease domain-containing protein n=2 Tax=Katanobacteria TaxID=422282 RepID=A0A0G0X706_UNCKA|nr:MAG: hypothetical protein UU77_C0014G0013 [candidate division WWE3 bacterium GW2011_GWC1_41_7]